MRRCHTNDGSSQLGQYVGIKLDKPFLESTLNTSIGRSSKCLALGDQELTPGEGRHTTTL